MDSYIVVVNLKNEWMFRCEDFHGKTRATPYEGLKVKGKPIMTFVRGILTYEN